MINAEGGVHRFYLGEGLGRAADGAAGLGRGKGDGEGLGRATTSAAGLGVGEGEGEAAVLTGTGEGTAGGRGTGSAGRGEVALAAGAGEAVALPPGRGRATRPSMMWTTPLLAKTSPSTTPASPMRSWPAAGAGMGVGQLEAPSGMMLRQSSWRQVWAACCAWSSSVSRTAAPQPCKEACGC